MTFSFAVFNIQFAQDIKSICITPLRQIVSIHHFASTRHFSVVRVSNPVELTNNRGPDVAEATKTVAEFISKQSKYVIEIIQYKKK